MMRPALHDLAEYLGFATSTTSHREKWVAAVGGMVAMASVWWISRAFLPPDPATWLVASIGASIVLLFAVPHGALSQPWPVLGGQVIAAFIGVTCAKWLPVPALAACVAIALTLLAMAYLRCVHPPGGATALVAAGGGPGVHALGYQFVLTPVLANVLIVLAAALLFNNLFNWRRYPAALQRRAVPPTEEQHVAIEHADFVYALSQLDSYVDVSEHDLLRIYELATQQVYNRQLDAASVRLGRYYSNGEVGDAWSVRQIVDESPSADAAKDQVIYRTIAGTGRRDSGVMTRTEFAHWARYEVVAHGNGWKRVSA